MSSTAHWWHIPTCPSDDEDTESSSDESEISVTTMQQRKMKLPVQGTDEHTVTVARHVDHLVRCYVSVQTATQLGSFI